MTIKTQELRRRSNGTIDIEYYRADAKATRNQAIWDLMHGAKVTSWALLAAGVLLVSVIVAAPHRHVAAVAHSGNRIVAVVPQLH